MFTSTTFLYNSRPNRVQTGAEKTVSHRTDDRWAQVAKKDGKVIEVKKDFITVQYDDELVETFQIGKHFGTWSGAVIPHEITTQFKPGDRFSKDDVLTYNSHYFEPDPLNVNKVLFKRGVLAKVVLWESNHTLEDSSQISRKFAKQLDTGDTIKRYVKIPFDHAIELLVKEGDTVDSEAILCNLRPPLTGLGDKYSADARASLDLLTTMAPTAKADGVVDRIEVMYSGDIDHMSETLQELVSASDAKLYKRNKQLGIPVKTAYIDPTYRIDNVDVGEDQVVVVFYITSRVGASVGDKIVIGHQLKSIIGSVIDTPHIAEDGTEIDLAFGRLSISNRMVNSMDLVSTTNTVLELIEKEAIEAYVNKNNQ